MFSEFKGREGEMRDSTSLSSAIARGVAFRDVKVEATDSRTLRVALVPPRVFVTNKGPYFLWPRGDEALIRHTSAGSVVVDFTSIGMPVDSLKTSVNFLRSKSLSHSASAPERSALAASRRLGGTPCRTGRSFRRNGPRRWLVSTMDRLTEAAPKTIRFTNSGCCDRTSLWPLRRTWGHIFETFHEKDGPTRHAYARP